MTRRVLATVVVIAWVAAAVGCGSGGGAPNPSLEVPKSSTPDDAKPGRGAPTAGGKAVKKQEPGK